MRQAYSPRIARRCATKYCCRTALRSSPSLQATWDTNAWGRRPVRVLSPRQGRPNLKRAQLTCINPENSRISLRFEKRRSSANFSRMAPIWPDLGVPHARATEFSWSSRFQNLNPHGLNLRRYDFHQNPPSELRVMHDFPKSWKKFVGPLLDPVLPRRL